MINKLEIDTKGREFNLKEADVQRDYIFGWVLQGIYSESILGEQLVLKGGNALRKVYYPETRFSKDLDFSVGSEVDPEKLKGELKRLTKYLGEKTGVEFDTEQTSVQETDKFRDPYVEAKQIYEARLYFKSFYGEETVPIRVQLDVTSFDEIILPIQNPNIIHPYSDADICIASIRAQKLEEILASKMSVLLHRRRVADLFDLGYSTLVSNKYDVNRGELLTVLLRKLLKEKNPLEARQDLYNVPIEEFRSDWENLIVPSPSRFSFDLISKKFRNIVDEIFSSLSPAGIVSGGFPNLRYSGHSTALLHGGVYDVGARNAIISAGKNRNLLEIVYDGYRRFVEPYALEYRIRKSDGVGQEYFWAFDQSGGKSGRIGIKMFIYNKIQNAEVTDKEFLPQYEVEF